MASIAAAAILAAALPSHAYDFLSNPPIKWPAGDIPMDLQLDATMPLPGPLRDGQQTWNAVAREAIEIWNAQLNQVQFTVADAGVRGNGNDRNEVFFSSNVYGHRFGDRVLAVTTGWHIGSRRLEADTVFNNTLSWDSYRGAVNLSPVDLRRVAIHEFGHTLGLDHPNQAKQVEVAVMNSIISDLDTIADDDIRGIQVLYPPNQRFPLNVLIEPPGSGTFTASPAPGLDGLYGPGQVVTLTARPARRNRFTAWAGGANAVGRKLKVRPVDNRTIIADFSTNPAPRVLTQPVSQFAGFGDVVTLRVRVASATPVTYQWQLDGVDLPAATEAVLVLNFVTHEDSGLYSCHVANARGTTTSKAARLVVDGY